MGEGFIVRKGGGGSSTFISDIKIQNEIFIAPKTGNYFIECIGPGGDGPIFLSSSNTLVAGGTGSGHYQNDIVFLNKDDEVTITIDNAITSFGFYLSSNKGENSIFSSSNGGIAQTRGSDGGMAGGGGIWRHLSGGADIFQRGGHATFGGGGGMANRGNGNTTVSGGNGGIYGGGGGTFTNGPVATGGLYGGNGGNVSTAPQPGTNTTNTTNFPELQAENIFTADFSQVVYKNFRGLGNAGNHLFSNPAVGGGGGGGFGGNGGNIHSSVNGGAGGGGGYGANGASGNSLGSASGGGGGGGGFGGNGASASYNQTSGGSNDFLRGNFPEGYGAGEPATLFPRNTTNSVMAAGGCGGGYGKGNFSKLGLVIIRYEA